MKYFVKTPWWLKKLYPQRLWSVDTKEKIIYLTFDDGPHPVATPFVLDELKKHSAKASFFCIGKNVIEHPLIYKRVLAEEHVVGNHTQNHLNGWKTGNDEYFKDILEAAKHIHSTFFRPPYGRIRSTQATHLKKLLKNEHSTIVMWDVLSGDFDESINNERCLKNVIQNAGPGSIIVFHDSEKAFAKLQFVLPQVLQFFTEKGYVFRSLEE